MTLKRALATVALGALALLAVEAALAQTAAAPQQVEYASVEVVGFVRNGTVYEAVGWGSGALVDSGGLVLTAFHVVGERSTGRLLNDAGLAGISMVQAPGTAPVPMYFAKVMTHNVSLDVALLQVDMRLDGTALPAYTLFPALSLPGLRDRAPATGDPLTAYGFGAGFSQPLVGAPGQLSRQGAVEGYGGRPMVVSATVPYGAGLTGGPVVNADSVLVGLALGQTGGGSDVKGVARPWDEILAWATGQFTQTQTAPQVVVSGKVVDGATRRGIYRAVFYVLQPNVTAQDFLANPTDADVAARGGTDRSGVFVTDPAVPFGAAYHMVVYAEDYGLVYTTRPVTLDARTCRTQPRCDLGIIELESLR